MALSSQMEDVACLGWARRDTMWWPVYVCSIEHFRRDNLHYLNNEHQPALELEGRCNSRLLYHLGAYKFASGAKSDVKQWRCPEHDKFCHELANVGDANTLAQFNAAMAEAKVFLEEGTLPFLTPSDLDNRKPSPKWPTDIAAGSLVWLSHGIKPWAPAYLFDPNHLSAKSSSKHNKEQLARAQRNPRNYYLVYQFGDCRLIIWKRGNARMLPWKCPDHSKLLLGVPKGSRGLKYLEIALQRLDGFLATKQNQKKLVIHSDFTVNVSGIRSVTPKDSAVSHDDENSEEDGAVSDNPSEDMQHDIKPPVPPAAPHRAARMIPESTRNYFNPSATKRIRIDEALRGKKTHAAEGNSPQSQHLLSVTEPTALFEPIVVPKPTYIQNGVAWAHVHGQLWWPVYICNPILWGPVSVTPKLTCDVYSFGYHTMRSHQFELSAMLPWKSLDAPAIHQTSRTAMCQKTALDQDTFGAAVAEAEVQSIDVVVEHHVARRAFAA
ncbi:hypothetical protein, variant [Aphanomyces invadans]|uniref:PWWP domain-containing protein n=1 Tax=Aphanomyces invadans TaxID=157072 RepID=A0A024UGM6_9STRA|nr:hypothetical protein, variant [Aphanomyces invadans]ETW05022.1 hypothetical protein, variant [Aphanomyces invadans]|eukprot:XP_008866459.1 hypothetical protein, variant [Aphanomyces invadans]